MVCLSWSDVCFIMHSWNHPGRSRTVAVLAWPHIPRVFSNSIAAILYLTSVSFSTDTLGGVVTVCGSTAAKIAAISVCVVVVLVGGLRMVTAGCKDGKHVIFFFVWPTCVLSIPVLRQTP